MISNGLPRNPKVMIGIPAYRNEKTIRATLESILAQNYGDFKVVISDDVSPDRTAEICLGMAATDPRITFVRQPKNLNYGNFRYLVKAADTGYFMWLAGDDTIGPDFIKENLKILEARDDVVLSVSRCLFVTGGVELKYSEGTYPLMGSVTENILRYVSRPGDNTRMYGIFRTSVLKRSFPEDDFFGYDFAVLVNSLLYGKHYEIPDVMMTRDYTPRESRVDLMRQDGDGFLTRTFPALALTKEIYSHPGFPRGWKMTVCLLSLNIYHHYAVCQKYHPRYARILPPLVQCWDRHIAWRANPWRSEEVAEAVARAQLHHGD